MHFSCRSFIGKSGPNSWCQYWENEPDDRQIYALRGHLFALISISSENVDTIKQDGRDLIEKINSRYFQNNDLSNGLHLKNCLEEIFKEFPALQIESLAIVIIRQQQLLLHLYSDAKFSLIRLSKISQVVACPEKENIFQISGSVLDSDSLLIFTSNFQNLLGWEKIKALIINNDLPAIEENIPALINNLDDQSGVAASFIQIHDELAVPTPSSPPQKEITLPKKSIFANFHRPKALFVSDHQSPELTHRKKSNIIIGIILLLVLGISITLGFRKNQTTQTEIQYQKLQSELTKTLSDGYAIKNLNIDTAKALGIKSSQILDQINALKSKQHQAEISQFQSQIQSLLNQTGSVDPTQKKDWYDTSNITNNPGYSSIAFINNTLYLLDSQNGRIDQLNTSEKSIKTISQSADLKSVNQLIVSSNQVLGQTPTGIVSITKDQVQSVLVANSISSGLWNGLLYLLDTNAQNVFKVTSTSTGFGALTAWLKENESFPSQASSIAINGKIWILSTDGTITPYLRGVKDNFKPSQPIKATNARHLISGLDTEILAFIDGDSTVYVIKKNGETQAKYSLDKKISSIALDETNNVIFALCVDQKIYKISL